MGVQSGYSMGTVGDTVGIYQYWLWLVVCVVLFSGGGGGGGVRVWW